MQPHQPFMYGPAQPPYNNGRFQASPYSYTHRGRMAMGPSPAVYRSSSMGGATAMMSASGSPPHTLYRGGSINGNVLPALHGTHMVAHNRIPLGQHGGGGGGAGGGGHVPMPPPPAAQGPAFMRRTSVPMQPHTMGYGGGGGGSAYQRTVRVGMPPPANGGSYQSAMNGGLGSGAAHANHATHAMMMMGEAKNGGMPNGRGDVAMKGLGSGAAQRVANLPTLPPGSAPAHALHSGAYGVPPPMMHVNFPNGMMMPTYGGGGGVNGGGGGGGYMHGHASGARGDYQEASRLGYGAHMLALKADDGEARDTDSMTPSMSLTSNVQQNGCHVNTPPMGLGDDEDEGLTPSPPSLRFLTSYEEEEVKEYLPNVYFGGTEQCKKVHGVRGAEKNDGYDDDDFHYRIVVGDHLLYRYEITKVLGQGTFGIVVRALDHKYQRHVAVKVIKSKPNYTKQAREEIKTLELLNGSDPDDESNIVRLLGYHIFRKHYVLVFELLPSDLYALIQANKFRPMARAFIYELSEQLLTALVHVRDHQIVHCDLKPENITVAQSSGNTDLSGDVADMTVKLIDFGSACEERRPLFTYIQSRYYRAPEIVLGIPYTTAIDMWSFGCVLCELANGYPIFPASSEGELLERIVEYFGSVPAYLVRQGRRANRFFEDGQMKPNLGKKRTPHPPSSRALRNFLKIGRSHEDQLFEDFVAGCLRLDARERLTPDAALEHPWMELWRDTGSSGDSSTLQSDSSCSLSP
ncbi:protein kinase-like protein [Novymonas esmeraldas]|uniref:Protein kinase-like protein n=1 Tax=Novymonas esmeraldas TaxID=1808958 RepID=A0AAW0EVE3_9TRYP